MLASIQRINKIFPIPGADRIEGAEVLGWKCVVRKGMFEEGDLCIYIEIDTIIPKQLLDETYIGNEVVRLRTVKMRGQISQGLVLDTIILSEKCKSILYKDGSEYCFFDTDEENSFYEEDDITDLLNVKKYEKKIPPELQGLAYGNFPGFIPKTDEVKIQSEPHLLEKLYGKPYHITQKLDGTSATYYKYEGHFGVCSRNLELKDGKNIYWKLAKKYNIESWLNDGYAIQGEVCGPGIQKNRLELKEHELFIFNFFKISEYKYLPLTSDEYYEIDYPQPVPFLYGTTPWENVSNSFFDYSLEQLLDMAKGKYDRTNNNQEGIVVRSLDQTISFKVVNNDYLLKDEE